MRMHVEYHKWWSPSLGQEMELKVYGHYGKPAIVFPAQGGRFYEYEDFGMVQAVRSFIGVVNYTYTVSEKMTVQVG
mgnify:CR=1 FL=1